MAQGSDEGWVLGELERLKREVRLFERRQILPKIQRLGFNAYQAMLLLSIAAIPSLPGFWQRALLLIGVVALYGAVGWFQQTYLPHAMIYLTEKREGLVAKLGVTAVSRFTSGLATAAAGGLATYLSGWWKWLMP